MISRKEKYKSKKPKILVIVDEYINIITRFWDDNSGWIILGIITGVIFTLPGWIYIFFYN